ncbi:hypothetical protein GCM10023169_39270 [Georgenia halophila]|uniref:SPOR domain-containing protein n=1 Tax=Georgenia halophila TaxID=620889 RepID=A0ABP8LPM2_9MICO
MSESAAEQWYYDLGTKQVVQGKVRGATNRMGPYASAEEAAQAMKHADERNEEWTEEEKAWNSGDTEQ